MNPTASEQATVPTCSNCGTEWPAASLYECDQCGWDDFGECCIDPANHDCEGA